MAKSGGCATTIMAWAYKRQHHKHCRSADPRIVMPMGQVRTWMRLWKDSGDDLKKDIKEVWKTALRKMADQNTRWMRVRGPLAATIATLMDIGWTPALPNKWLTSDKSMIATFDAIDGVTQYHVCHSIESDIHNKMWRHAAEGYCGRGLQAGIPILEPAMKAQAKLLKEGEIEAAKALVIVSTNRSWPGERLMSEGIITNA